MADIEHRKHFRHSQGTVMHVRHLAVALGATLALSACGSAKDANKANFANAINSYYSTQCVTIDLPLGTAWFAKFSSDGGFPASVANAETAGHPERRPTAPFEALEKAGLLTSKATEVEQGMFGTKTPGREYALTEAGSKALEKPGRHAFCVGHRAVDEVVQFTEPNNGMGQTVSQAKYTYSVVDVPAWAKDPAIQAAFPDLAQWLTPKHEAHVDLVLMNDGWSAQPSPF